MQGKFQHSHLKAGAKERENDNCQPPCIVIRLAYHCRYKEEIIRGAAYGVGANFSDIPRVITAMIGRAEENTCLLVFGKQRLMCIKVSWTADRRLSLNVQHMGNWLMSPNSKNSACC
jgi:hypothetical protein